MCNDCTSDTKPFTKEQYDEMREKANSLGFEFTTKYRKGLKHIRLGLINLPVSKP